jgi:phosphoglucosamine mutase
MGEEPVLDLNSARNMSMSPEEVLKFGKVFGKLGISVVIGRDCNPGSMMMMNAFIAGMLSVGTEVWDAGIMPTPAIAFASKNFDFFVMVGTPDRTGDLPKGKIYNKDGSPLDRNSLRDIIRRYNDNDFQLQPYNKTGTIHQTNMIAQNYIEYISASHNGRRAPIILDCGCGSTSLCAPHVLAKIGCDLISINAQIDGDFRPRPPGISNTDIASTNEIVASNMGSIGIALNGDGTHLALIDEAGRYVSLEEMLALILLHTKPSVLALPVDMSAMIDDAFYGALNVNSNLKNAASHKIIRTDGTLESTTKALKEEGSGIGVTNDGAFIFSESSLCPDAIHASIIISEIASKNSIRDIISSLPKYVIVNDVIHFSGNREVFTKKINDKLTSIESKSVFAIKGWRVEMRNGWFTISFNEDLPDYINLVSESRDKAYAITMMEMAKSLVFRCV